MNEKSNLWGGERGRLDSSEQSKKVKTRHGKTHKKVLLGPIMEEELFRRASKGGGLDDRARHFYSSRALKAWGKG